MKRWLLAGLIASSTYYITWPDQEGYQIVQGKDRRDALAKAGAIVWTQEEWMKARTLCQSWKGCEWSGIGCRCLPPEDEKPEWKP